MPYGWQFKGEEVCIKSTRGKGMNYLGLLSRNNHLVYEAFSKNVNAEMVIQFLDKFSMGLRKQTVVVLDNASIHTAKKLKKCFAAWQHRGLYIFYLPPYSPHLNIIERFWKELKEGWIRPQDYETADSLCSQSNICISW
ncbi:MAG: IS630 family transposase [Proteobacteria bacterium]|nr:IS630 family transposase [Pseudomonadota bacterium]